MGLRGRRVFDCQAHTYFITTTVMNFARVFSLGECYYSILRDSLRFVVREHQAKLLAFVFMPSHIYLLVDIPEGESISDLMRDFKKYTSTKVRQQLERDGHRRWIDELRRNASGKAHIFKLWMDRFDDVIVETEPVLKTKIEYIHDNPVRAGLVARQEDWPYSSARNYLINDFSFLEVCMDWW